MAGGAQRRARRTVVALGGVLALLSTLSVAGCAGAERGAEEQPDVTKAAEQIAPDAADPDHAVAAPASYDGTLFGDDLLLVSEDTIPADELKQITGIKVRRKKGVAASTVLSYGQFSSQNKLFNIAAVQVDEYRAFTGQTSAEFAEQWERIAGGEVAVAQDVQKELPIDGKGYLTVGKQKIHVGAWSPSEVDGVDAMVNARWGEELGLPEDNALLINTGLTSPQAVRDQIEKALGKDRFSITALDIVAQAGIDVDTFQNVIPVGAFSDAVGVFRYTPIGGGRIAPDPAWVASHIVTEQVPILGSVTCNKYMMPQLKAALGEVQRRGLGKEIHPDEYAGCYYPRFIAGSTTLSNHSFGLALDFNVPGNQRGTVGEMNREVVAIFKYWGFAWGGDWAWTDPMHFEMARIVNPG